MYKCTCEGFLPSGRKEATTTKTTITGLYPATSYTFTVTATTKCGDGKESNAVSVKAKPGGNCEINLLTGIVAMSSCHQTHTSFSLTVLFVDSIKNLLRISIQAYF